MLMITMSSFGTRTMCSSDVKCPLNPERWRPAPRGLHPSKARSSAKLGAIQISTSVSIIITMPQNRPKLRRYALPA